MKNPSVARQENRPAQRGQRILCDKKAAENFRGLDGAPMTATWRGKIGTKLSGQPEKQVARRRREVQVIGAVEQRYAAAG